MLVVTIPDIVVTELIQVGLEPPIVVHVHVSNEDSYGEPSVPLPT